jgi:hypothetical protein
MDKYALFLHNNTADIETVCEFGAGLFKNFHHYACPTRIGIELVPSYIANKVVPDSLVTRIIEGNALEFEKLLGDTHVDAFAAIDFIEHLDKDVGIDLIKRMQQKARRILIFAPHGTCHQDGEHTWAFCVPGLDGKMGKDRELAIHAQKHRSTWYADDLKALGFSVEIDPHFMGPTPPWHDIGTDGGSVMWAVWNK